jgi:hypothetical protein
LAGTLLENKGIECAIGFFNKDTGNTDHCMILVNLNDLDGYGYYYYYDDLTSMGLSGGRWIIIEPQSKIDNQHSTEWFSDWNLNAASEIINYL